MEARKADFDAIVIGAGFAGLRMLHELRELGLSAQVFEAASDVGGTWYWNRYPGARTDSESWVYAYSFSKELQDEWNWSERFPPQPEALAYLQHVADRFDMRKDIAFDTRVESAAYDERVNLWTVRSDKGGATTCRYLISAVGVLSTPYVPPFPGIETFKGEWYVTGRWPKERVDFAGKRVVVIGTGATAIQAIPIIAETARHLTVLQRTPNYVLPARNGPLTEEQRQAIRRDYDEIWAPGARALLRLRHGPCRAHDRGRDPRGAPADPRARLGDGRLPLHLRELRRHLHRREVERGRVRVHPQQDPHDREGPGDRGAALPQGLPAHRQAPAARPLLLRDVQPREREPDRRERRSDHGDHREGRAHREPRVRGRPDRVRDRLRRSDRHAQGHGRARPQRRRPSRRSGRTARARISASPWTASRTSSWCSARRARSQTSRW